MRRIAKMNLSDRILALREGGQTVRAHIIPYVGTYNVAMHSYNAANMLLLLCPKNILSMELVKAVLWHDVAERWTGDTPATAKWASPILKATLDRLEAKINNKLGITVLLTTQQEDWLRAVDLLELYVWTQEQLFMGNRNVEDMATRIKDIFQDNWDKTPVQVREFMEEFEFHRTVECNELIRK